MVSRYRVFVPPEVVLAGIKELLLLQAHCAFGFEARTRRKKIFVPNIIFVPFKFYIRRRRVACQ